MKSLIPILSLLAVSCGNHETSSLSQEPIPKLPFVYHTTDATVTEAATIFGFPGPNGENTHQTTATVQIKLQCGQRVHSFLHSEKIEERSVKVNYQAVIETDTTAGACETDPQPYETHIMIDGVFSKEEFKMKSIARSANETNLREGETHIYPATQATVKEVGELCPDPEDPNTVSCDAEGSYIIVELAKFGCVDRTALVNWTTAMAADGKSLTVDLAAFGVNHINNQRARCSEAGTKRTVRITTQHNITTTNNVKINLLR